MTHPPIPKREKIFPDPNKHINKKKLQLESRQVISKLRAILPKDSQKDELVLFLSCVAPAKERNVTRLPVSEQCKQENKVACLFSQVSRLIVTYWDYCTSDKVSKARVENGICKLQEICEQGLVPYKMSGDIKRGYWLK